MPNPYLSIVLTTKNSISFLKLILPSIVAQSNPKSVEVILADNLSEDGTCEYAQAMGCRVISVSGNPPQTCKQRNKGIKDARGEYVLILDHDMELASGFILSLMNQTEVNPKMLAWYIHEKVLCKSQLMTNIRNFENLAFAASPVTATRLFHRSIFDSVGYYDENLSDGPGDWDLDMRIHLHNIPTGTIHSFVIHHEEYLTLTTYLGKKYKYVSGSIRYRQKWQNLPEAKKRVVKQFSPIYRTIGFINSREAVVLVIRNPVTYLLYLMITLAKAFQYFRGKLTV